MTMTIAIDLAEIREQYDTLKEAVEALGDSIEQAEEIEEEGGDYAECELDLEAASLAHGTSEELNRLLNGEVK